MPILDRYLVRETIPPFLLALGLFTFALAINPFLEYARLLLAKGVPIPTVGVLLLTLVPQAMSLTVPMAFLAGLLMALGRLSGDRESVALLACGVSPVRLLRPVLVLAAVVGLLDFYILMKVKPDANQAFREITFRHLTEHTAADIKPRVFFESFPGKVLYVQGTDPDGSWRGVLLADTTNGERPSVTVAERGSLAIDQAARSVQLVLRDARRYVPGEAQSQVYTVSTQDPVQIRITAESVFGSGNVTRGIREMSYAELKRQAAERIAAGDSPHNEIMQMQQIFSFPVACLVFGVLGLAVGLNTRREGRLAGLVLGLAIVSAYYFVMQLAEAWVKGGAWTGGPVLPAVWARWVPNLGLGLLGLIALGWRMRGGGSATRLSLPVRWGAVHPGASTQGDRPVAPSPVPPRLVLRIPEVRVPGPRILDRYVGRQYLRIVLLTLGGLLALYYIGATVDLADKLFKGQADGWLLTEFLWQSTPQFVAYIIPMAVLVAVLGTIGALTRTGELVVMRACGISLYRVALPMFFWALAGSAALFAIEDRVLGHSNPEAERLQDTIRSGNPVRTVNVSSHHWLVGAEGRIYHYAVFESANRFSGGRPTIHGLSVFASAEAPYRLTSHTFATRASFQDGKWLAEQGWTQAFAESAMARREFVSTALDIPSVEDFRRAQVDPGHMTFGQLKEHVARLAAGGFSVSEQEVKLHHRIAFPAVTIVMTLLAIPFGVTTGRKGALYGIGLAAVLAGAYFLLLTFFTAVGAAGVLPAPLAAWAANLLFAAGAIYMMLSVRT